MPGGGYRALVLGAGYTGAGSVLAPASDSEVITTSAACSSDGRPSAASDNEVPAVTGRVNLCTQHHTVLALERSLSISAVGYLIYTLQVLFWPTAVSRAVLFARILLRV